MQEEIKEKLKISNVNRRKDLRMSDDNKPKSQIDEGIDEEVNNEVIKYLKSDDFKKSLVDAVAAGILNTKVKLDNGQETDIPTLFAHINIEMYKAMLTQIKLEQQLGNRIIKPN